MNALKFGLAVMALATAISLASRSDAQTVCNRCSSMAEITAYLNSDAAKPPAVQGHNTAIVTQLGTNNSATSDATVPAAVGTGGSYYGNYTVQTQVGANNSSDLQTVGNSNLLVSTQVGNSNTSSVTVYGNNNIVNNTQIGSGLNYSLQRVGNSAAISVTQRR